MFIDEVGAADVINNIDKSRKTGTSRIGDTKPAKGDKLDIARSSEFQLLIKDALAQAPDVREDKVKELSQRIGNGSYLIPLKDLSKKIMESKDYDGLRRELFS